MPPSEVIDGRAELVAPEPDISEFLWPLQRLAFETEANEIFYGGARGGGKSFLMRMASIIWACECPGIVIYLFRRTYPELWKNHMEGDRSYPWLLARMIARGACAIVGKEIRFWNGAKIFLNHLQHTKNVGRFQGQSMQVALFDELTQFTEASYLFILTSVRVGSWVPPPKYKDTNFFPRILCSGNPGGIGHDWVKRRFVDHKPFNIVDSKKLPARDDGTKEGGKLRIFIPARAEDNPSLLTNDPDYLYMLESMGNPALVLAMREGNWDVAAGAMFAYVFRERRHVFRGEFTVPVDWDLWRGADDGFGAPFACYWVTQNPDTGTFYVLREIYRKGMLPDEAAEQTLAIDHEILIYFGGLVDVETAPNDAPLDGEMDSAAFSEVGASEKGPRAKQMNEMGTRWSPVSKAKVGGIGFRVMRVQMMHQVLAPNKNEPKDKYGVHLPGIKIHESCVHLIRTLPKLMINEKNPEDVDQASETHAFDAITYALTRKKRFFSRARVAGI